MLYNIQWLKHYKASAVIDQLPPISKTDLLNIPFSGVKQQDVLDWASSAQHSG